MRHKLYFFALLICLGVLSSGHLHAQRNMENLNRGIVAVRTSTSEVLISWRILGPEYTKDATYNLYQGSTLIASDLTVSNYVDNTASETSCSEPLYTAATL